MIMLAFGNWKMTGRVKNIFTLRQFQRDESGLPPSVSKWKVLKFQNVHEVYTSR